MNNYSILFPGQGSQSIGMMESFADNSKVIEDFDKASEILKKDLWAMVSQDNDDINKTENTQPIMLIAGITIWNLLKNEIDKPKFVAGHSLGELTALLSAEVVSFEDALKIVAKRASLMQAAIPQGVGAMAAIIGLDDNKIINLCNQIDTDEVIEPVNFNSPGQVVIAGHKSLIEKSLNIFKEAGAKRALLLPVSVPSHCSLMKPITEEFASFLNTIDFSKPKISIIHNVDASIHTEEKKIKDALVRQLYNPVQWTNSIEYMLSQQNNCFVEVGPGKVLSGLNKRISKESINFSTSNKESLHQTIEQIKR